MKIGEGLGRQLIATTVHGGWAFAVVIASTLWADDLKFWAYTVLTPGFPEEGSLGSDVVVMTFGVLCFIALYLLGLAILGWLLTVLFPKIDWGRPE